MTVSINIDLDASKAKGQIEKLRAQLESLDDDLDLKVGLDGDLKNKLEELGDTLEDLTDGLTDDLDESIERLENLDIGTIVTEGDGDSGGDTGSDSGDSDRKAPSSFHSLLRKMRSNGFGVDPEERGKTLHEAKMSAYWSRIDEDLKKHSNTDRLTQMRKKMDKGSKLGDRKYGKHIASDFIDWPRDDHVKRLGLFRKRMKAVVSSLGGATTQLKNLVPSMGTWYKLIAALIPALGAFAVNALGVAAALGSVAVAGAAVVGLGLVGQGDDMASAWDNAQETLGEFKENLFEVFQPVAQLFSMTSERFFDFAPNAMEPIAESMKDLLSFEDSFFSMFEGAARWVSEFIDVIAGNEKIIEGLASTFGSIIGTNILQFFEWLLQETAENADMLIQLGGILKMVATILYNVFIVVSHLMIVFKPLFELLTGISEVFNGPLMTGLLTFITIAGIAAYTTWGLYGALLSLGKWIASGGISSAFATLSGVLSSFSLSSIKATLASLTLSKAIATLVSVASLGVGIGLAAWAAKQAHDIKKQADDLSQQGTGNYGSGPGSGGPGSGYGGGNTYQTKNEYNVQVNGDADESTVKSVEDVLTRHSERDVPSVGN